MILVACTCDEGFGLAHDHFDHSMVRNSWGGKRVGWLAQHDVALNPGLEVLERDAGIRVWVDWAELGRRATRRES